MQVLEKEEKKLYNGNPVPWESCVPQPYPEAEPLAAGTDDSGLYRVYDKEGYFIGIYRKRAGSQTLHPDKLFFDMPQ